MNVGVEVELIKKNKIFLFYYFLSSYLLINYNCFLYIGDWGLGIGDWGLWIGDWAQSPIPNPQSPYLYIKTLI